jgi:hypothetical protein
LFFQIGDCQLSTAMKSSRTVVAAFSTRRAGTTVRKYGKTTSLAMSKDFDLVRGFESICLHGGYLPDETTSRGVPLYRTAPYAFKSTDHAADLFALKELGNIYSTYTLYLVL